MYSAAGERNSYTHIHEKGHLWGTGQDWRGGQRHRVLPIMFILRREWIHVLFN